MGSGNLNLKPPLTRRRGKKGRQLAGLLLEELNNPQWPGDARKVIMHRAVEILMTGYLTFETKKFHKTTGTYTTTKRQLKAGVKEWIDLFKFVNNHIDGPAKQEIELSHGDGEGGDLPFVLPADIIAPSFMDAYRDIVGHRHTEYVFSGGRGSTKSSFISLAIIYLLKNNPAMHALAMRQVQNTLRDSVYAQLQWAIGELGLSDEFKCTMSPAEIEYLPTGQKIYFRGADDPGKIKSIKPTFGYIGILWFEELDQFHGAEAIRKIEQSVIRGGDEAYIFKSFNPPPTANNWANKYVQIPKDTQYLHRSDYRNVPAEWLGKAWLDEAEHLKNTNPKAYDNEYLGLATNDGGMVFDNVRIETITDEQIAQFDHVLIGHDWGFYPDPASTGKMNYDAARRILYIYGEFRGWKMSNRAQLDALADSGLITKAVYTDENGNEIVSYPDLIIADSAEPKSVNDFRAWGANCRGAEKGPESVKYSMKWLQGLNAIIIDPVRAPYHAQEFLDYEFERTKDGEIISEFPDKNNHAIDDTRYATNLIWRKRGE